MMKEKRGKKIKVIQRERKKKGKDNKSTCEAGRNKLHHITGTKGSLSRTDKIFIQHVGIFIFIFNCLRRFKFIASYLQLYQGFLLATHHHHSVAQ